MTRPLVMSRFAVFFGSSCEPMFQVLKHFYAGVNTPAGSELSSGNGTSTEPSWWESPLSAVDPAPIPAVTHILYQPRVSSQPKVRIIGLWEKTRAPKAIQTCNLHPDGSRIQTKVLIHWV